MRIRAWVRAYFGFSRIETNGFLILMPLTLVILFWGPLTRSIVPARTAENLEDRRILDSLLATIVWRPVKVAPALFQFDPNLIDSASWTKLGLSSYLTHRILGYRSKGGSFRKKEDLLKIYQMDTHWYQLVKDSIKIQNRKLSIRQKLKPIPLDINQVDSTQLLDIRGIGPVLSRRIILYRERLGGFISLNQLQEVYGLDTLLRMELNSKFFVASNFEPRYIFINEIVLEELSKHPYFKWQQARAIILYRFQHGAFESTEDFKKIQGISVAWIEKIKPYLKFK